MSKLNDLPSAMARLVGNMCLTKANAVIGATASAFTTGNAITTMIDGILRTLAAQTNTALSALVPASFVDAASPLAVNYLQPAGIAGFYTQPANTTAYYVLCVNAAGTIRVVQGTYVGQPIVSMGLSTVGDGNVPDIPDTWVAFAILKVVTAGSAFVPGTTALTSIGTFLDVSLLPANNRP